MSWVLGRNLMPSTPRAASRPWARLDGGAGQEQREPVFPFCPPKLFHVLGAAVHHLKPQKEAHF